MSVFIQHLLKKNAELHATESHPEYEYRSFSRFACDEDGRKCLNDIIVEMYQKVCAKENDLSTTTWIINLSKRLTGAFNMSQRHITIHCYRRKHTTT